MKLKVRITFRDKETNKIYRPGEIIDITDETRSQDMLKRKLCEAVEAAKPAAKEKAPKKSGNAPKAGKGKTSAKENEPVEGSDPAEGEGANPVEGEDGNPENSENQE